VTTGFGLCSARLQAGILLNLESRLEAGGTKTSQIRVATQSLKPLILWGLGHRPEGRCSHQGRCSHPAGGRPKHGHAPTSTPAPFTKTVKGAAPRLRQGYGGQASTAGAVELYREQTIQDAPRVLSDLLGAKVKNPTRKTDAWGTHSASPFFFGARGCMNARETKSRFLTTVR
jgi:hypothetical protein